MLQMAAGNAGKCGKSVKRDQKPVSDRCGKVCIFWKKRSSYIFPERRDLHFSENIYFPVDFFWTGFPAISRCHLEHNSQHYSHIENFRGTIIVSEDGKLTAATLKWDLHPQRYYQFWECDSRVVWNQNWIGIDFCRNCTSLLYTLQTILIGVLFTLLRIIGFGTPLNVNIMS